MAETTTTVPASPSRQTVGQASQTTAPKRPELHFPLIKILIYIFLTLGALLFAMPFLWMLSTSLMTPSEIAQREYIPGSKFAGFDAVTEDDWQRPLAEFLPPRAEISFRGESAVIYYNAHSNGGVFDVSIDGQLIDSVDTYSPETERREFVVDSYPEVPTLSLTQSIQLSEGNHVIQVEFNEASSQHDTLWLEEVVATRNDGSENTVSPDDFDFQVGQWQTADNQTVATKLDFPVYLEDCCRAIIGRSTRLQRMPLSEFIDLERPSGSHSNLTTDFIPFGLADTLNLSKRYVVTGSFSHYVTVWNSSNFSEFFVNSVIITALTVFLQTVSSVMAAYAFARMEFPGRNILFAIFLMTLFIPTMVVLIPNLLTVTWLGKWSVEHIGPILDSIGDVTGHIPLLGKPNARQLEWIDNWPGLVFPFIASTFSIFLLRQFFMQIPNELWDAARIDGAGHVRFLFQIVVPISRAALTTVMLFTFITTWNALEWPLLVTTSEDWRPISYALYRLRNDEGNDPQLLMAGAMIALLPVMITYLIAQRQFTEGIATTGLKG